MNTEPADDALLVSVHAELRRIAQAQMGRERDDHTLQATALVHEAWLALQGRLDEAWSEPRRFHLAAAELYRALPRIGDYPATEV